MNIKEKDNLYIANTYARFDLQLKEGKGSLVYDEEGKEYIDMATGIAVNTFGFCDDEWIKAVNSQLNCLQHASNLYYTEPCVKLAEMLCEKTGMKKVFFSNSGAEANECAIKVARKYAADKKGKEYNTIITLKNSFHGRTITTLAATGQDVFHNDFLPLTDGFVYCEANNCEELENIVKNGKIAAIMFETVQGEGGVLPLEDEFVKTIFELAENHDILTIADEVQTGNGRTGALYGFMNYGVTPDIFSTAKGLGGGLPLGATVLGEKVKDVLNAGSHGSTFGGNPIASAGAVSILSRIDDELLKSVREKSQYIVERLSNAEGVKSVSGKGFMLGIETEKDATEVINECMKNGVLVIKAKNKVRLLPALNIPMDLLEKAVDVIKNACERGN
ncbi:MAG: acetylornithine/succinylornithine family transaminase [Clostridia bacterium]|nr:acetylornithine/succinylornithine family transaminase [Clostridia bacterium]